ncbi:MAG: tetratricopeptide repeat protein [Acidobacteria bacterium]|nr:tetratricopeptide repeat protein [Acidobacteriota bacterium]MBI3657785.1 tetratricopeptide repeat protein [Acidobacteriota bacterium]
MEKNKESGAKLIDKSKAASYAILVGSLGLIIGFSIGFYLSNRWNMEAQANRHASPGKPADAAHVHEGGDSAQQMDMVRKHLDALKQKVEKDPKDAQARIDMGNMYYEVGKMEQAIEWYKQALDLEPNNVDVRTDLATAYFTLGQLDKAEIELQKSLSINPSHVNSLINLGIVKIRGKNDTQGAVQLWEKVLALNTSLPADKLDQIKQWVSLAKQGNNPFPK